MLRRRVEQDALRITLHFDRLDRREGLGVEHHDGLAAGEAVTSGSRIMAGGWQCRPHFRT